MQPVSLPRWAHPVNIIVDENIKATIILCNQFLFPGGVLNSRPNFKGWPWRSSLLGKEGSEDEGGEGKLGGEKGKKTTPEGTQFLTLSHPFVSDNNELCERKGELSS